MKRIVYILFVGLMLSSCENKTTRTDYVINGTAKDVYNGIRVYLLAMDQTGRNQPIDTAIVFNETFSFKGNVNYPSAHYITLNGINGRLPFMLENSEISITIDKVNILNSTIEGSKSNDIMKEYNENIAKTRAQLTSSNKEYRNAQLINDSVKMLESKEEINKISESALSYPYEFIEKYKDRVAVLQIFANQLQQLSPDNLNMEKLNSSFSNLDEDVKSSEPGVQLKNKIDQIIQVLNKEKATKIGAKAPEFSAPNPQGNEIALSEVVSKGKVTIIDFWAAWCGPCRRENPNVVKVYEEFHDKGLEIIGVGLDGRRGQQNPKQAWIDAIEKDGLTWHQVSNLRYFDEIAQTYNVNSIPAMFVLDENGIIVAKNLRGAALGQKIGELLN